MIQLENLQYSYGSKKLFTDLNLELSAGNSYGLLGLNGAGKTTLLKLLAGLLHPINQGMRHKPIKVFEEIPSKRSPQFLSDTFFVAEDPYLPPVKLKRYLQDYIAFWPKFDYKLFYNIISSLEIDQKKLLTTYSYGQKKKLGLALALASNARLLLFDEPTNGLDIPSKAQLRMLLAQAKRADRLVIISTHQVHDLAELLDPLLILHEGKLLFSLSRKTIEEFFTIKYAAPEDIEIDGARVVYAEQTAQGYVTLCTRSANDPVMSNYNIEIIFNAAIKDPERMRASLFGQPLPAYNFLHASVSTEVKA